jgi:hypothetical protein
MIYIKSILVLYDQNVNEVEYFINSQDIHKFNYEPETQILNI